MISKKIHYCWFGGTELPPLAEACLNTWKKLLPEYELIRWDESNSPNNDFIKHHLERGNWAFVSDYVRLHALFEYGGIYFDTDIEVVKAFDALLDNDGFVAYEDGKHINNAVAGSVKGNVFFKHCMDYMIDRFEKNKPYHVSPVVTTAVLNSSNYDIKVFDSHYFYPYNPYDDSRDVKLFMYSMVKGDTFAIHHWAKSWTYELPDNPKGTGLCSLLNDLCSKVSNKLRQYRR